MPASSNSVCVVIAAHNAEDTIERAVASALAEPEVAEVILVDDLSADATCERACGVDDGTRRLKIIRSRENRGPAAARNRALFAISAPLVAILDSDDRFLPGRFAAMLAEDDWDMIADNIVFVPPGAEVEEVRQFEARPEFLDLARFVEGNISRRGRKRGEIGFLKPVMRRSFLEANGLRYRENLRLGEDYDLYARALACGARYKVVRHCGYLAVERPESLSGRHRTEDLLQLFEADLALLRLDGLGGPARDALRRHSRQIAGKYAHRRFLDLKREEGIAAALGYALSTPNRLPAIAAGIFGDKVLLARECEEAPAEAGRYLFRDGALPAGQPQK